MSDTPKNADLLARLRSGLVKHQTLLKSLVVGGCSTVLDIVLLQLAIHLFAIPDVLANVFSYSCGILLNFVLNRWWTYPGARRLPWQRQFGQFAAVNLTGLLLNTLLFATMQGVFNPWLGVNSILPAKGIATVCVFFWNYLVNRRWTFQNRI